MSNPDSLFVAFQKRVHALNRTRCQIDILARQGKVSQRMAEQLYESLFLSCFTSFEVFIEDAFLRLLTTAGNANATPRMQVKSPIVARELVIGPGKKYVDWCPYERTIERANLFFRGGRPFTNVPSVKQDLINKAQVVRHAIAHRSRYSQERFERVVIGTTSLAPRERRPGGFLSGIASTSPLRTRYEVYIDEVVGVARIISGE